MLKCITFDGDTSTLNTLMGYFEKLDKALADVHQVLSKEQTERPIFEVFSVDNLDDFFGLKAEEMELSYYRKSEKVKTITRSAANVLSFFAE